MGHGERNVLKNEAYHERLGMLPLNPLESAMIFCWQSTDLCYIALLSFSTLYKLYSVNF